MTARYDTAMTRLRAGGVMILDGGVSTELEKRGAAMDDAAWSGRVALDDYQRLVEVHLSFIEAGAEIITTNTYATSRLVLERAGLGGRVEEINRRAVEAAFEARSRSGRDDILVAGSVSHMIPVEPGGYGPDLSRDPPKAELCAVFEEMLRLHERLGVDVVLLEMLSAPTRMEAMFEAMEGATLPVWCGLAARRTDEGLRAWHDPDTPFADIAAMAAGQGFHALGIMHSSAELIGAALDDLRAVFDGPLMAYPDSGYFEMPHWKFVDVIAPGRLSEMAEDWRSRGAQVIGGCCGLGPEHIAALSPLRTA